MPAADVGAGAVAPAAEAEAPSPLPAPAVAANATSDASVDPSQGSQQAKSAPGAPKLDPTLAPLLIYEGALQLDVPAASMTESVEAVIDAAEGLGGFLLKRTDSHVEVRVPSQHFRTAMKAISKLGDATGRSVTAQDVSEEFHDLAVRLKNLEAVRDRLEQFLARTKNVQEALQVGKELNSVAQQIDQIKGRMQFLKTRAAYSVIRVTLRAKQSEKKIVRGPDPVPPASPRKLQVDWIGRVGIGDLLSP
ncbi:MAG TPA: DUF4349 domain-containing protein [Polyangiaceae bacterium]|nr:DUF4349 domain-containing protein [Polyangiaceae bacterium]